MGHDDVRQASEQGWDFVVACLDRVARLGTASSLRKQAEDALAQSGDWEPASASFLPEFCHRTCHQRSRIG